MISIEIRKEGTIRGRCSITDTPISGEEQSNSRVLELIL
jgi:hypothetical protein